MATHLNRRELLAGLLASAPGAAMAMALTGCGASADKKPDSRRLPFTISKETTYITEPLRPDGYPDYVAALNQRCSQGVTPENNAAVLFWKAMGPSEIEKDRREAYFKMLGIAPLPEKGDYFRSSSDHVSASTADKTSSLVEGDMQKAEQLDEQFVVAMERPWSRQEFPVWAEWLDVNERPMALLAEASKRPRRYDPWFCDKDGYTMDLGPMPFLQCRDVERAFAARAMLRIHEGRINDAWEDILVCYRQARLLGQGPTLVESLFASHMESKAQAANWVLLHYGQFDRARIDKMRQDLTLLSPRSHIADVLDVGERFFFLNSTLNAIKKSRTKQDASLKQLEEFGKLYMIMNDEHSLLKQIYDILGNTKIDWNTVLRTSNSWYDRIIEASREPLYAKRKKSIANLQKEYQTLEESVSNVESLKKLPTKDLRKTGSERIGEAIILQVMPSLLYANNLVDQKAIRWDLTQIAFALAAYRADHNAYPEKLADLTPKYLDRVPKDIFNNDAELHYARQDDGYVLYSVGLNEHDDGGKDWDDLVVRMPVVE